MSKAIHFGSGRIAFIKLSLLILLIVALFAIINFTVRNSGNAKKDGHIVQRAIMDGDRNDGRQSWDAYNPCYEVGSQMFCGPAVYLMGIQYAGLNILKKAIGLHPDVDCYASGFFSLFTDLTEMEHSDVVAYFRSFNQSTQKIQSGADKLCICDSGNDLARPYDLNVNKGIISPPKYTTPETLVNIHSGMKVIVVLRDPTVRFIREYCALGMTEPLEEVVDEAIEGFEKCENDKERVNASCVYDINLSGLLQAGLYDFLIEKDLNRSFSLNSFRLIAWDHLENPMKRNATMISIFNFLGKDIPYPDDPYWTALDDLFVFPPSDCNGQTISTAAKQKLNDFYRKRAIIYDIVCE